MKRQDRTCELIQTQEFCCLEASARAYAYTLVRDNLKAEEFAQEALFRLFIARTKGRDIPNIAAWIKVVVLNLAKKDYRMKKKRTEHYSRYSLSFADNAVRHPLEIIISQEDVDNQKKKLENAPPGTTETVRHRFLNSMSIEETARALGASKDTIKYRTLKGKKLLEE